MAFRQEGGSPIRSLSIRPQKIDLALSEELENTISKKWGKPPERLFGHFMSALLLVFLRNKKNRKFMEELDKAHEDIESHNVNDIKVKL